MNDNLEYMIEEAENSIQRRIVNKLIAGAITFVVMVTVGIILLICGVI